MPTVRRSYTAPVAPTTYFTLECDYTTESSNNRTKLSFGIRAINKGNTDSAYGSSGYHRGYVDGSKKSERDTSPFMTSGYNYDQQRWWIPATVYVNHNSDGVASSDGTVVLRMTLGYGSVSNDQSYNLSLPRIPKVPGTPGTPVVSGLTPTAADLAWTAASRGHADIEKYGWRIRNAANTATIAEGETASGAILTATVDDLDAATDYLAEVRAYNDDGWGSWSSERSFSTLAGGRVRNAGEWGDAVPWIKRSGVWYQARPWVKVAGVWQQVR